MELVGFRSRQAVSRLVDRLVAEGLVTKDGVPAVTEQKTTHR